MNDAYCRDCALSGGDFYVNEAGILTRACDICPFFERYSTESPDREIEEKKPA